MKNLILMSFIAAFLCVFSAHAADKKAGETTTDTKTADTKTTDTKKTDTATAKPVNEHAAGGYECKSGNDVRKLEIMDKDSGCDVQYTKGDEAKSIGEAKTDKTFCTTLVEKVKSKLESSGYTCSGN